MKLAYFQPSAVHVNTFLHHWKAEKNCKTLRWQDWVILIDPPY